MKKSIFIQTYGCQMNKYDSDIICNILEKEGYKIVNNIDKADIVIINTCSVRKHAEDRAINKIMSLQSLRKKNPNMIIGVVGCMAQNLKEKIKGVDFIIGPSNYRSLPKIINKEIASVCVDEISESYSDIYPKPRSSKISAFVCAMRGCDNFCSYCIVPYVRGRKISRPPQDIIKEIELLKEQGIKEVILLGQSINEYEYNGMDFADLLVKVSKIGIPRIRFITSHPKYLTDKIIDTIAELKLPEFIHLPIQAGSNKILKLMNRGYTKEDYLNLIDKLRNRIPNIAITTDIITGFPGEEDNDFEETLDIVRTIKFDFAYMFQYSDREGTKAYYMNPKIPDEIKKNRLKELIDLQNKITLEKNKSLIGKTEEVLVEGKSKKGNFLFGKTRQNKVVLFNDDAQIGSFIKVEINSIKGWTPFGKISS